MGIIILGFIIGIIGAVAYTLFVETAMNDTYAIRNGEQPRHKAKKSIIATILIVPILMTIGLASTTSVGTGEIAVMTRFGRVTGEELGEGFHIKNPLDKANKYDVKTLKEEAQAAAASKDLQDVSGTLVVNYSLEAGKVSEIHRTVGALYKEKLIDPAIQEVFKASTAKYDATQLIIDRQGVKQAVFELLRDRLASYGIIVQELSITNFGFSPEFTQAIEAKQVAQQGAEQAVFNAQKAEQDAQAEINRAKGSAEAQRLQQTTLTPLLIQKQFLEKWDGKLPAVTGDGNLLDVTSLIGQ